MTIAEMIAELRARGKTLVEIGRKLQVTPVTVQRWAHGEFDPRYQQGKALEGLHQSVVAQVCLDNANPQTQQSAPHNTQTTHEPTK